MTDQPTLPDSIGDDETLARFILFRKHIRHDSDGITVKADAFIPPPSLELSVTRHDHLTDSDLWRIGRDIASNRQVSSGQMVALRGRANVQANVVTRQGLKTVPDPLKSNPWHANVTGWPEKKPAQKNIAEKLAASARFFAVQ
jgi:hypothetical protein